jgi:hypothetical protein
VQVELNRHTEGIETAAEVGDGTGDADLGPDPYATRLK